MMRPERTQTPKLDPTPVAKRYEITAPSENAYHDLLAKLRGLGANIEVATRNRRRIVADVATEPALEELRRLGATVTPYKE